MRYEGDIYRPPSEAYSLLLQVTIGCSHNKCTFCSMFKDKRFRVRNVSEVIEDLEDARRSYSRVERIFLCDGDALCLANSKLAVILDKIRELFPECLRVNVYGNAKDVLHKTPEELKELHEKGVQMIYLGAESGDPKVLEAIHKGVDPEELIEAVQKVEASGIQTSVTFISGLAGKAGWRDHAIESGKMISRMNASYVALLTLMLDPRAPIYDQIQKGQLELLSPEEVIAETYLLLENANPSKTCVFRSNHASNYLSLKGNLPEDKEVMLAKLKRAMEDSGMLKDERFRML
ncbi:B12-binding domain-containing radical SAM protein [Aminicella lysinilytica]|uniref:Radical SAM family protein n=1 Tax=Aminicella lysinilytica TaxID=433323 RepID=A0A4R6QAZ2_9FIRM|nr:radical SAM protein [Aminicella lysinilytica]NLD10978.1 B12-binding domain-containing radical SAM protein [Clostridiales bacterium]TDP59808.1 radical SAM family protein [Aminicella lysinilytica]